MARYLPFAAVYVFVSFAAFQLDGIFIGASRTRDMRNAAVLSLGAFLLAGYVLVPRLGNSGLRLAFVVYVAARALTLGMRYERLRSSIAKAGPT